MTKTHTLIIGAVLTAILFALVEFAPEIGLVGRLFMIAFAWLFISYGVWSLRELAKVPGDFGAAMAGRKRAPGAVQTVAQTAAAAGVVGNAVISPPPPHPYVAPELEPAQQDEVRAMVAALAAAGVFAPQVPDPAMLFAGVADWNDALMPEAIFAALTELHYHHPEADDAAYFGNLAFVDSKAEQNQALIEEHISAFDALTGGALAIAINRIDHPPYTAVNTRDVEVDLTVNGAPVSVRYRAAAKYLSTELHVTLARCYHALGASDAIATYWTDQGVWLMRLSRDAVAPLNAALRGMQNPDDADAEFGPPTEFAWLHEEEPFAAGLISLPQP